MTDPRLRAEREVAGLLREAAEALRTPGYRRDDLADRLDALPISVIDPNRPLAEQAEPHYDRDGIRDGYCLPIDGRTL